MIAIAFLFTWAALALLWRQLSKHGIDVLARMRDADFERLSGRIDLNSDECTKLQETLDDTRQEFKNLKFSLGLKTPKRKTKKSN